MHGIRIVRHIKGNLETVFKVEPKQSSLFLYSTCACIYLCDGTYPPLFVDFVCFFFYLIDCFLCMFETP